MAARRRRAGVSFETLREIALALPGAEESTSYGTPAFKVKGKLFVRLKEDAESIVIRTEFDTRDALMAADPEVFFITDHYRDHAMVLVRLGSVTQQMLREVVAESWRLVAPRRLLTSFDAERRLGLGSSS